MSEMIRNAYSDFHKRKHPAQSVPKTQIEFVDPETWNPPRSVFRGDPIFTHAPDNIWMMHDDEIGKDIAKTLISMGTTIPSKGWYLNTGRIRLFLGEDEEAAVQHFRTLIVKMG